MTHPLWAPWRMEYILGKKGESCIFCDFFALDREFRRRHLVLAVQEHALVVFNRYPFTSCHLLVAPRRHVSELSDLTPEEYDAVMHLLRDAVVRVQRAVSAEGINVGFNLGKVAGAGIAEHLHGHVVPRWAGDTNFMPVIADVRVMPEYLDDAYGRLAPHFSDLNSEPIE